MIFMDCVVMFVDLVWFGATALKVSGWLVRSYYWTISVKRKISLVTSAVPQWVGGYHCISNAKHISYLQVVRGPVCVVSQNCEEFNVVWRTMCLYF